jgi:hypothetical protein
MKKVVVFFVVAVITLSSCLLFAQEAAQQDLLTTAVNGVINNTLIPIIIAFIGSLVSLILIKLKKKLNIQVAAETEAWLQNQAESAVQLVAEKAAARLKVEKVSFTKNEKLNIAIAALISKAPKLTREQADEYVHSALARIPGIGATGDASLVPDGK